MICEKESFEFDLDELGLRKDQIIILSVTGSNMYGTTTPDSDKDYIGVYMPTKEQLLLNDFPKSMGLPKNSEIDLQIWSIHHFMKLACQGETLSIDLLHAPYSCWLIWENRIWEELINNRHLFFTKEMNAFVSYARKQAAKYGVKGTRIASLEKVIKALKGMPEDSKLTKHWSKLPEGEHIHFLDTKPYRMYQINGKKYQETVSVGYILEHVKKHLTEYGKRAMIAKDNKGIDWKGVSHAIRSAEQVYAILKYGDYNYPLANTNFIKNVKLGKVKFDVAQAIIEGLMSEIEILIGRTDLPETVDKEFWNKWLIKLMEDYVI
jgi:thermostable 8-oxoguanine DNA glycosylase